MVDSATLRAALPLTLAETNFTDLGSKYEGKVRDNYTRGGKRIIVVTDRISAFDRVLGTVPFKGQVLNRLAAWWFEKTKAVAENHMIGVPDPNVLECVECTPVLVEMVVRAYATGTTSTSLWTHYERGVRVFCGHELPEGLRKHQRLPSPIITPTTKAPKGEHDVSGSREEILASGLVSPVDFDEAAGVAMKLFVAGQRMCSERGLILVDTKYEFGRTPDGRLVVIDEIHTPDSSRFWEAAIYEPGHGQPSYDKQFVRDWLVSSGWNKEPPAPPLPPDVVERTADKYREAYRRLTGHPLPAISS
jgi:phosphoribosylaminoimidazole-succinocarboxamide synthase